MSLTAAFVWIHRKVLFYTNQSYDKTKNFSVLIYGFPVNALAICSMNPRCRYLFFSYFTKFQLYT
ncbi:hypothetical protein D3Z36_10765 [Lachnospiraceae bacterium]|nr:hypothetical protein [Lachnospiraceae bacterium]